MIRLIYNLLFPLGLLLFLPGYIAKMRRRGNYRRNFGQRFAIYSDEVRSRLAWQPTSWIHAVSVGEVAVALRLATKLRELDPAFRCVLTTTTTTGYTFAEENASTWMEVMYNPIDFWPIMRRAFTAIRPERIILVEAEVWPNLAAEARRRRIPISLVNARLSPRSERRFRKFRALVAPTFRCLDLICVQESGDVERWTALGVSRQVIEPVGSIKYDPTDALSATSKPREVLRGLGIDDSRLILFGGSTHAGEEEILATVFLRLRSEFPNLSLIIAPRHVERAPEIRQRLKELGLRVILRREVAGENALAPDCLLIDTTGELHAWYAVATTVFVGKSLAARGGQNPVEPILEGKPVLFGPHMENFSALTKSLLANRGAIQVTDPDSLAESIAELLRKPESRRQLVKNAQRVLGPHRGATRRTAELVLSRKSRENGGK